MFREILREQPQDPDALAGLGDAEFTTGAYRDARAHFQMAAKLAPDRAAFQNRVDETDEVLVLDPTLRGIGSDERRRRSVKLVKLALESLNRCLTSAPPDAARRAGQVLKGRAADTEANLDLSEELWQIRLKECQPPGETEKPLALVLAKLAR
jgi:hypothetical protein